MSYIPLNVKTGYSFLSSSILIHKYINEAKKLGFNMLGISDINSYGFPSFYKTCIKNNITPFLGMEININYKNNIRKINLYIENEKGYLNLCQILKKMNNEEISDLNFDSEGLTCIIPSLSSNWFSFPLNHQYQRELIYPLANKFKNFYIGIECYSKEDKYYQNEIYKFADNSSYKTIAFPKIIALKKHDGLTLNMLNAIKEGTKLDYFEESNTPYFLISETAAKSIYRKEDFLPFDKFKTTFNLFQKRGKLLSYNHINNKKEDLYEKCLNGLKAKNEVINTKIIERLNHELTIIEKMGYLDYFYIVKEYVNYAKNNNIKVGPGRGSAGGSLVSYALNITDVNPLKYDLLFERFLNPERVTMPDIDVDFLDYKRDEVIKHITSKYGSSRVKPIITFQTIGPKKALRDVGDIFSFNISDINNLCNSIKNSNSFLEVYKESSSFRKLIENDHYKLIASLARKIEGFPRQKGLHAAGIIINDENLHDVLPIIGKEDSPVPFEAPYLEELNFLKMDILGLRNLSIIESIVNNLKSNNINIDLNSIPLDDKKTFQVLNDGLTKGIFQLESEGITKALKEVHIDCFNDIVAINALYRPGPMDNIPLYARRKKGLEKIEYLDSRLEPILKETYGVIVYQEQVMKIVQDIASFSLGKADLLRRAISKKDENKLKVMEKEFIDGAIKNNLSFEKAKTIYNYIYKFADYGFNKSHSVCYSYISYQLAYLKANYPAYFYSTLLNTHINSNEKYTFFFNELSYFSLSLLPPSINESDSLFKVENNNIRIPLEGIKNIPSNVASKIIEERNSFGKFASYSDSLIRLSRLGFEDKIISSMIEAGAFDCFAFNRTTMKENLANHMLFARSLPSNIPYTKEELSLLEPIIKQYNDIDSIIKTNEFNALGVLLSGSLFDSYNHYFKDKKITNIENASKSKYISTFPALISSIRVIVTKSDKEMALIECYDNKNTLKLIAFPSTYEEMPLLKKNDAVLVTGYLSNNEKGTSYVINKIIKMEVNNE